MGADRDRDVVAQLLGREPAGDFAVVVRDAGGAPVVIENAPLLRDGSPMPTRYWLVDPLLRQRVSRLEADGGVRRATEAIAPTAVADAHARHAAERDRLLPPDHGGPAPSGGVGGTRRGVKCLHAHLAWHLAGGDDPVGRWTAAQIEIDAGAFVRVDRGGDHDARPVAAIDCGTNSTRLIVELPDGTVLEREMRITRLGQGVDATHRLAADALERTFDVLRDYREIMDRHGVARSRVVATSAVRDADNAEDFMRGAEQITGQRPEVLSGDEEGRLSFTGATAHLHAAETGTSPMLVVDIGGGSTEISVGRRVEEGEGPQVATRSLDIGCVRVSERFFEQDPPSPGELRHAREVLTGVIDGARHALPALGPDSLLIGLAGTVSTLASLQNGVDVYERARIHHARLGREDVEHWLQVLASEDAPARLARPGMEAGREDVIVGGVLILAVVMAVFGLPQCLVSEDDILDGLAQSLLPT